MCGPHGSLENGGIRVLSMSLASDQKYSKYCNILKQITQLNDAARLPSSTGLYNL